MNVADDATRARRTVFVSELTDGILDPAKTMLGPLIDGGTIVGNTAPGCWGPMITPRIRGGHEVTRPVFIANAEPGDAVVLRIRDVNVTSFATSSGHDRWVEGHYLGDPYAAPKCPNCETLYPETYVAGTSAMAAPISNRCRSEDGSVTQAISLDLIVNHLPARDNACDPAIEQSRTIPASPT